MKIVPFNILRGSAALRSYGTTLLNIICNIFLALSSYHKLTKKVNSFLKIIVNILRTNKTKPPQRNFVAAVGFITI